MNEQELRAWLQANEVFSVRVESVGVDGWLMGKYVSPAKLVAAADSGIPTADLIFAFDLGATPILGWWDDWRGEIGDVAHAPDLDTLVVARTGMASVMADLVLLSGDPVPVDPRANLRRLVEHLRGLGYEARVAAEIEAYVYAESLDEARARGFADLTPLGDRSRLGYAVGRSEPMIAYMDAVARRVVALGIDWEAWSNEVGPGQVELNVAASDPLHMADSVVRIKTVMREVAAEMGHCVTFMSKPLDDYANGLHLNHSLLRDGEPVFLDETAPDRRSPVMHRWLGGLMASMAASMSFFSPTPTSYRRLKEADGPPTTISWGENNKTTGIRTITRSPKSTRIEHRVPASDANVHYAIAAVLAGGIRGIEDELAPPPGFTRMAWNLPADAGVEPLPRTITKAADALEADVRFAELMGPEVVRHWLGTRRWEWLMFHTTGGDPDAPTGPWERQRYFEWV